MSDDVISYRKSNLCDYQNKQERAEKPTKGSGSAQPKDKPLKLQSDDNKTICKDLGDCAKRTGEANRFVVEIDGKEISVSKLFVYPDFSESVGQIEKNKSKISTPSKKRKRGYGTGYIECKPITSIPSAKPRF